MARRINDRLRLSGIVFCLYESGTRLAVEVGHDVEVFFEGQRERRAPWSDVRVFQTRIRRNIRLAESPSHGQSIFEYAPDSHGAEDYRQLAAELLTSPHTISGAAGNPARDAQCLVNARFSDCVPLALPVLFVILASIGQQRRTLAKPDYVKERSSWETEYGVARGSPKVNPRRTRRCYT